MTISSWSSLILPASTDSGALYHSTSASMLSANPLISSTSEPEYSPLSETAVQGWCSDTPTTKSPLRARSRVPIESAGIVPQADRNETQAAIEAARHQMSRLITCSLKRWERKKLRKLISSRSLNLQQTFNNRRLDKYGPVYIKCYFRSLAASFSSLYGYCFGKVH